MGPSRVDAEAHDAGEGMDVGPKYPRLLLFPARAESASGNQLRMQSEWAGLSGAGEEPATPAVRPRLPLVALHGMILANDSWRDSLRADQADGYAAGGG